MARVKSCGRPKEVPKMAYKKQVLIVTENLTDVSWCLLSNFKFKAAINSLGLSTKNKTVSVVFLMPNIFVTPMGSGK
jgi:hypothetical protein